MVRLRVLAASPTANMAIKLLFFLKTAKRMRRFHETDGRCACPPERQRRRRFLPRFSQCGRASLRPASPSRGCCFTTFCHQKVAPKVSARHLRRDRTSVLAERARKTALIAHPLRAFEPPSALFPPAVHCGNRGALRATMISVAVIYLKAEGSQKEAYSNERTTAASYRPYRIFWQAFGLHIPAT